MRGIKRINVFKKLFKKSPSERIRLTKESIENFPKFKQLLPDEKIKSDKIRKIEIPSWCSSWLYRSRV